MLTRRGKIAAGIVLTIITLSLAWAGHRIWEIIHAGPAGSASTQYDQPR